MSDSVFMQILSGTFAHLRKISVLGLYSFSCPDTKIQCILLPNATNEW